MWWFESNEGGFQKLGRLSRHSNHHLLTWSLRDLRGFDREVVMSEVDRELMWVWVCHGYVRMGWGGNGESKRVVARRLGWPWAHESNV
eukprot:2681307-Prymnesium_polylepis.1